MLRCLHQAGLLRVGHKKFGLTKRVAMPRFYLYKYQPLALLRNNIYFKPTKAPITFQYLIAQLQQVLYSGIFTVSARF
jgi:hypothetical protein